MRLHRRGETRGLGATPSSEMDASAATRGQRALMIAGAVACAVALMAGAARLQRGLPGRVSRLGGQPEDATPWRVLRKGAPRYLRSFLGALPFETLALDVKFKDWRKIVASRVTGKTPLPITSRKTSPAPTLGS